MAPPSRTELVGFVLTAIDFFELEAHALYRCWREEPMNDEGRSEDLSVTRNDSDVLQVGLKQRDRTGYRVIAFKVSHILVSLLFLWLL